MSPIILLSCTREKAVFATHAHVFQIDPETKKKWLPSSTSAVRVAYYHDPARRTYRIIAIENNKVTTDLLSLPFQHGSSTAVVISFLP